ncbi:MAG: Thymidylate kinase [Candidatus Nomurabacteria bacterium GW2011_GWE1_32_28]|uniref:Thymidylate kinase n=1 Tax=Candidatus Nomurabacteria bacterium GW2011_GWF1_31_48 TaxID=1618767 RepID=A0A0G0ATN5_9BACT|nr:MAG: Thymidylate kinase [Candidatus Nomurabacteria bacterium GW2011_GWF2_30_133]KKP28435.1 MAG: Thymidylate kinase [Candidatus Nomurabacteria bacterium GW2011_GWE2_31_40]KKP30015.1 MAG: Thymidylate kinase [Candidatus Nomurabacteria bacterium GW2011_GWF1_31_48]KKP34534.1 MAG: Thymidylate kinase [Candidatus Nomurabacteria bacterium GW2011_GWE1_32_28]HAS81067.1 thymidylate kinase [Candidatus Nomurabacteria bacterium]
MSKKGKLIVIDGTDGSGKATQVELLAKRLKKEGKTVKIIDFPDYYSNFFGKFIGHCLTEQYYNFVKVHPKIASVLYAADRFESKIKTEDWLKRGYIVIANRYVSANQIHQGGKIANIKKRQAFIKWLDEMEYKVFKIPRPNVVIYLNLSIPFILSLIKERNKKSNRSYVGKKKDIVEGDIKYLTNSQKSAVWLAKTQSEFVQIKCVNKNILRTREDIHEEVYEKVKKITR